jgi:hypothetical protein
MGLASMVPGANEFVMGVLPIVIPYFAAISANSLCDFLPAVSFRGFFSKSFPSI